MILKRSIKVNLSQITAIKTLKQPLPLPPLPNHLTQLIVSSIIHSSENKDPESEEKTNN